MTFDPLSLCDTIAPLLKELSTEASYSSYLPLLQRALLSRLLAQVAQVYRTMKIAALLELVAPLQSAFEGAYGPEQVEAFLIGCARAGDVRVRVDHASGSLEFLDDAFASPSAAADLPRGAAAPSGAVSADTRTVQPSAGELVRTRLSSIANCLHSSLAKISPPPPAEEQAQEKVAQLVAAAQAERKGLQVRRAIVARRRELLSELSVRKEKEEASRRAEASRREKDEEAKRALEDIRKKESERVKREIDKIKTEEARQLAQSLKDKGTLKVDLTVSKSFLLECRIGLTISIRRSTTSMRTTSCDCKYSSLRKRKRRRANVCASSRSDSTISSVHSAKKSARYSRTTTSSSRRTIGSRSNLARRRGLRQRASHTNKTLRRSIGWHA